MSDVLMEFLEPYEEYWENEEQLQKLLSVAVIAWNAALMPGGKRDDFLQDMEQAVPAEVRQDMRSIVLDLVRRKLAHFADIQRTIISYELTMTPDGPHLSVLSTLSPL